MGKSTPSRRELERLHRQVRRDSINACPDCEAYQDTNGLVAWCENGHVYQLPKTDPRYNPK